MPDSFAPGEIVEIAVQIEINGRDFYEIVAKHSKNKKAKDVFLYLASEEAEHEKRFREILNTVKTYEPKEAYPEEYFAYMRSLADNRVFTGKEMGRETAKSVRGEKDAVDLGINAEKYSIEFYEGMKKLVSTKDKNAVDVIINEEKKHLDTLNGLKEGL